MLVQRSAPMVATSGGGMLRYQLLGLLLAAVVLPLLTVLALIGTEALLRPGTWITVLAAGFAAALAMFAHRKVTAFPGSRGFAYVMPAYASTYGAVAALLLLSRVDYSGVLLLGSFFLSIVFAFLFAVLRQRDRTRSFYVVPFGDISLVNIPPVDRWIMMEEARVPDDPNAMLVADLRADHPPEWDRMLAVAAISGHPVYHCKLLRESMTGKVELEHLSENSFGSLLPNLAYRKLKRLSDLIFCGLAVVVLAIPMLVIALVVKLDSPGPVIFSQERMGFQGKPFRVFKFRTMRHRAADEAQVRDDAITQSEDARITRSGRFLRRSRLDELPQFWNVLRGEMSLIGPRPEAIPLSMWYEEHLPFYIYRHIVRPGITGWAQVNQGHVADLDAVNTKLHYDFYYIKNFSAWLDMLITMRTVVIMLTGFGSK